MTNIDKKIIEHLINDFKSNILENNESKYVINDKIKITTSKEHFNNTISKLKKSNIKSDLDIQSRSMNIEYSFNDKIYPIQLFFVEKLLDDDFKAIDWVSFFQKIEPEYLSLITSIINNIALATFRNEHGKVISNKSYYLDPHKGLMEKKEKFVNDAYDISYKLITDNITQLFRMFFKFYEQVDINELTNYDKFKSIIEKTKFNKYIK